eukprot:140920_1
MAFNTEVKKISPDKDEYYRLSAEKCWCHESCSWCTCRCCGLFILVCWIIFGIFGAIEAYTWIELTTNEWTTQDPCSLDKRLLLDNVHISAIDGPCCIDPFGTDPDAAIPGECKPISDAYTVALVQSILSCVCGVAGGIGLIMFVSWLLLIPLAYSIIAVILDIIVLILLGFSQAVGAEFVIGVIVAILIAFLFYSNWKIMRDALHK